MSKLLLVTAFTVCSSAAFAGPVTSVGSGLITGAVVGHATHNTGTGVAVGAGTGLVGLGSGCAPEDIQGNLVTIDKGIRDVYFSPEFANAKLFKKEIAKISTLPTQEARIKGLYVMAGVNPESKQSVIEFLRTRDYTNSRYSRNLIANLDLNQSQANRLLDVFNTSIAGELKK